MLEPSRSTSPTNPYALPTGYVGLPRELLRRRFREEYGHGLPTPAETARIAAAFHAAIQRPRPRQRGPAALNAERRQRELSALFDEAALHYDRLPEPELLVPAAQRYLASAVASECAKELGLAAAPVLVWVGRVSKPSRDSPYHLATAAPVAGYVRLWYDGRTPLVCLTRRSSLEDLEKTCRHELRHAWQEITNYSGDREADARRYERWETGGEAADAWRLIERRQAWGRERC